MINFAEKEDLCTERKYLWYRLRCENSDGSDWWKMEKLHYSRIGQRPEAPEWTSSLLWWCQPKGNQPTTERTGDSWHDTEKDFSELPPHTEYSITEQGRTLLPIIEQLEKWGDGFRPQMKKILGMED